MNKTKYVQWMENVCNATHKKELGTNQKNERASSSGGYKKIGALKE